MVSPYNHGQIRDSGFSGRYQGMKGTVNWVTSLGYGSDSDSSMRIIQPKLAPLAQGKLRDQRMKKNVGFSL